MSLLPSWNIVVAGMLYCLAAFKLASMSGANTGPLSKLPTPCDPRLYTWLATQVDLSFAVRGFTGLPAGNSWELCALLLGLNYKTMSHIHITWRFHTQYTNIDRYWHYWIGKTAKTKIRNCIWQEFILKYMFRSRIAYLKGRDSSNSCFFLWMELSAPVCHFRVLCDI